MAERVSRPDGNPAAGKIDHVFVILLENEPFDRIFADFPGADGDRDQKHLPSDRPNPWWKPGGPPHDLLAWRVRRFIYPFFRGKWGPRDRPIWWRLAHDYVLCDRHRTQAGPSTPNHVLLFAASSNGLYNNPTGSFFLRLAQAILGGKPLDREPPYDVATVPNRLEEKGISWANYGDVDFTYFSRLVDSAHPGAARNSYPTAQFLADAAAGRLAQVNWVFNEDVAAQSGPAGMEWVASIIRGISTAPGNLWDRSATFVTWDDWGGYYDHVQPVPGEAPGQFFQGGRVPLLVISPYAKPRTVFHEPTIHTSIPAFIERVFELEPLNPVDAAANDLMDCFDFSQTPLPAPVTQLSEPDIEALEALV